MSHPPGQGRRPRARHPLPATGHTAADPASWTTAGHNGGTASGFDVMNSEIRIKGLCPAGTMLPGGLAW